MNKRKKYIKKYVIVDKLDIILGRFEYDATVEKKFNKINY